MTKDMPKPPAGAPLPKSSGFLVPALDELSLAGNTCNQCRKTISRTEVFGLILGKMPICLDCLIQAAAFIRMAAAARKKALEEQEKEKKPETSDLAAQMGLPPETKPKP